MIEDLPFGTGGFRKACKATNITDGLKKKNMGGKEVFRGSFRIY